MQKSFRIILVVALIGLGVWGWRMLFPSPQSVIRSRLLQLAQTASFDRKDGALRRAYKAERITDFFTPDVVISVDIRGYEETSLSGRDQVQAAINYALGPRGLGGLKAELRDISVTLGADKQTAVANLTGKFTAEGQSYFIVKELNVSLKKVGGKWLIYRAETVRTLAQHNRFRRSIEACRWNGVSSSGMCLDGSNCPPRKRHRPA
jgi:ketosteroid isomerase-like protein